MYISPFLLFVSVLGKICDTMLRNVHKVCLRKTSPVSITKRSFLTKDYKCAEAWNNLKSSPIISKVNLNDFYNKLDQNYSSKGVISAIDVDIFAHALDDSTHLEELKELLLKLRLSAETGNTLESTHHATIRNFISFGYVQELVEIIKDPLNFGVFLDDYTANILLDDLLKSQKYELAAEVAGLVMLQEEFSNELTCSLCQYSAYKYIENYTPPEPAPPVDPKKKVEEIKIRIKFLRNPYFDDHFDIKDTIIRSGKTLAWISELRSDNLNNNLQIIGWLIYKKYDKLLSLCENLTKSPEFKLYKEVLDLVNRQKNIEDSTETLEKCSSLLENYKNVANTPLEDSIKTAIENAINKVHKRDIEMQQQLFQSWITLREQKLEEQTQRLDRAKRMQIIQEKQNELKQEEQKLWFFENEEKIDLQIEDKEKLSKAAVTKKKSAKLTDDNYVPPEIMPGPNKL